MNTLPFQFLLMTLAGWISRQQQHVIEYLQEENRVLREQVGDRRLRFTDVQRRRLAGGLCDRSGRSACRGLSRWANDTCAGRVRIRCPRQRMIEGAALPRRWPAAPLPTWVQWEYSEWTAVDRRRFAQLSDIGRARGATK